MNIKIALGLLVLPTLNCNIQADQSFIDTLIIHENILNENAITDDYENNAIINQPITIPVGANCITAWYLRYIKLRFLAYPFDWYSSPDFDGIANAIKNGFAQYFDPKNFAQSASNGIIKLPIFNFTFNHDFPKTDSNWLTHFPSFKEKYAKRTARFFKTINVAQELKKPILFLRIYQTNKEQAVRFVDMIQKIAPKLDFNLLVVDGKKPNNDWKNIPRIHYFYEEELIHFSWNTGNHFANFKFLPLMLKLTKTD